MESESKTKKNQQLSPFEYIRQTARNFLDRETIGGLLLIAATIFALTLANTSFSEYYHHILKWKLVFGIKNLATINLSIEKWINDGLMVIFFLVAGLELKREILVGELSDVGKASTPMIGALGGMVFPAIIFFAFNSGTDHVHGWGIPIATDIAYSLGIIGLLGKRVPYQLKIFLVALAIVDDIGAILVIAFFYSSSITWLNLIIAGIIVLALFILNWIGVKKLSFYIFLGIGLWLAILYSGIHPTIAGVLFAMTIPVKPKLGGISVKKRIEKQIIRLEEADLEKLNPLTDDKQKDAFQQIEKDTKKSHPPLLRLENALTGFNSYIIIPLFALANAGVKFDTGWHKILLDPLGMGILLGLLLGKVTGISLFIFAGQKLKLAHIPKLLSFKHIIGMGLVAGIGFTMSLFITNLAFADTLSIKIAKISILSASTIAAIGGMILLGVLGKPKSESY